MCTEIITRRGESKGLEEAGGCSKAGLYSEDSADETSYVNDLSSIEGSPDDVTASEGNMSVAYSVALMSAD